MKINSQNSGYTILVTLMIIGFLIVLTTGVLNLVLRELNDNRGQGQYLQTYAGAEGAMELALLEIKQNGYGVYNKKDNLDILKTKKSKVSISYDLNSITKSYTGTLSSFSQEVIPLFYISGSTEIKAKNIELSILNSDNFLDSTKMAWNIVSENGDGVGGNSNISKTTKVNGRNRDGFFIGNINLNGSGSSDFLNKYDKNYLILINLDPEVDLNFNLSSNEFFTKPVSKIITSSTTGKYKQNLETILDNTDFLGILKYSVFSN